MRSRQKHFDAFQEFLVLQPNLPDIICISETRIKDHGFLNINIPGYSFIDDESHTNAGRVVIRGKPRKSAINITKYQLWSPSRLSIGTIGFYCTLIY